MDYAGVLKALPALESLQLQHSVLGSKGVTVLAPAFVYLPGLKRLDLSWCCIDSVMQRGDLREKWLGVHNGDVTYDLASATLDGGGPQAVGSEVNAAEESVLGDTNRAIARSCGLLSAPGESLASGLRHLRCLEVLMLRDKTVGVDCAVAVAGVLGTLRNLRRLDMHGWILSGDVAHTTTGSAALAMSLGKHSGLQQLDLSSTNLTCDGVAAVMPTVAQHAQLTQLDLCAGVLSGGVLPEGFRIICEHLGSFRSIQKLRLGCREAGCKELDALARGLQPLTCMTELSLTIQSRAHVSQESFSNLLEALSGLVKCENLDMQAQMQAACAEGLACALKCMPGMRQLNLSGNRFGDAGAAVLTHAFRGLLGLERVSLGNCELTEAGVEGVVGALEGHVRMHECILSGNSVHVRSLPQRVRPTWVSYAGGSGI